MIIVNFFKGLFDAEGKISSKRVSGIYMLIIASVMIIGSQFTQYKLDLSVLLIVFSFIGVCFGMNTFLSSKAMSVKGDVASDMVDSNKQGANEDAKDVLNSDKP